MKDKIVSLFGWNLLRLTVGLTACLVGALFAMPIKAAEKANAEKLNFAADEVSHDRELGVVTARGKVEISYGERFLSADQVSYNTRQEVVAASGNVALIEPTGEVIFADYFELTGDLKTGVARDLRMILTDRSRLAAATAERHDGNRTEMERAVYSPCDTCRDNPKRPLLWQMKAMKVQHDQERQKIEYKDVWMEMWGVPVAYVPYISHPDPSVKRKSGLLAPSFSGNSSLGGTVTTPYYLAIDPTQDITFKPKFTGKEGVILGADYHKRGEQSKFDGEVSGTKDSKGRHRGHVDLKTRYDIDDTWRAGLLMARTTDDTYLRRYGYRSAPWLTTQPYVEGFRGRSYASMRGYSYQGLRETDDPGVDPLILPMMEYSYVGDPNRHGGYWMADAGAVSLQRSEGVDTRRASGRLAWRLPYTAPAGDVYTLTASVRGEGYYVEDLPIERNQKLEGTTGRIMPELALDWKYPFVRQGAMFSEIIEPVATLAVSPNGGNPHRIPNEDSLAFEFDDTNLFSHQRFPGLDRHEGGPRINYGLRWRAFGPRRTSAEAMFGQTYRYHPDSTFGPNTGLDDNLSDYVGRAGINFGPNLSFLYRFRLNKDNYASERNEVGMQAGPAPLRFNLNYIFINQDTPIDRHYDREQLGLGVSSALTKHWTLRAQTLHDVHKTNGGPLAAAGGLIYDDECFAFTADMRRDYTYDRDYRGGFSMMFRVVFKTLGELRTGMEGAPP
jgi:LPS-assembly protein